MEEFVRGGRDSFLLGDLILLIYIGIELEILKNKKKNCLLEICYIGLECDVNNLLVIMIWEGRVVINELGRIVLELKEVLYYGVYFVCLYFEIKWFVLFCVCCLFWWLYWEF